MFFCLFVVFFFFLWLVSLFVFCLVGKQHEIFLFGNCGGPKKDLLLSQKRRGLEEVVKDLLCSLLGSWLLGSFLCSGLFGCLLGGRLGSLLCLGVLGFGSSGFIGLLL